MAATENAKNESKTKNNDKPKPETESKAAASSGLPEGYVSQATDAVGFFDADYRADGNDKGKGVGESIHGVPLHVVLVDSSIEKQKASALVFMRLLEPCKAVRDGNGEGDVASRPMVETKLGDVVGVWFTAGMAPIANLGGVKVFLRQQDEGSWKKIKGKPSKMKTFDVMSPKGAVGQKLTVLEDRRKESAGVNARPFAGPKLAGAPSTVDTGDAGGDDDIPF